MRDFRQEGSQKYPDWVGAVRDYKAWAKRILWREEMKDPELLSIQVKFAKEALGQSAI